MQSVAPRAGEDGDTAFLNELLRAYQNGESLPEGMPPELTTLLQQAVSGGPEGAEALAGLGGAGGAPQGDFVEVVPDPAFVVKTVDETGRKVFVNMCGSEHVPAAGDWSGGQVPLEVQEALEKQEMTEQDAQVLRFPISMGEVRNDLDNKGQPCSVIDCIFNAKVITNCGSNRRLKHFLVDLALQWAAHKHKLDLDPKFKLPRLTYKGESPVPQRLRADKKPVVQEITEVEEEPQFPLLTKPRKPGAATVAPPPAAPPAASPAQAPDDAPAAPAGRIEHSVELVGRPVECMVVSARLPSAAAEAARRDQGATLGVSAAGDKLVLSARGAPDATVQLPFAADHRAASAGVDLAKGTLRVTLPVLPVAAHFEQMRREAPHAVGALSFQSDALAP
ncbi:unnamed protein product [Pedinophyceae sp. YPF-701]|nr:unnamed protein product [Pedinophyceae sp. YPF-701]